MRALVSRRGWRVLSMGLLTALGVGVVAARAVDPDDPAPKPEKLDKPPMVVGEPTPKPNEKTVAFEFRDKPWLAVLEWFTDQAGLPFIGQHKPTGTFTFIPTRTGPKQFTIPQIVDILNESLIGQKYILIRRNASFTIVPADTEIDPHILPRIRVEDLDIRGNTELVSVVLPLTTLVAEDTAPEIKKMLSPFGQVVAMTQANQLILTDTAGNLKRVIHTVKQSEGKDQSTAEMTHVCKYVKAREAERILKELLGDPAAVFRAMQPQMPQPGGGFPFMRPGSSPQAQPGSRLRMHYISSDERTNTVLVTGPADKIAQAREIMRKLDVPQPGQQPLIGGEPILKSYPVPAGNADVLARTLQEIYKASNVIRISAVGNSQILVWANADDQFAIAKHIAGTTESRMETELLPLSTVESTKIADTLKAMFGDVKVGAPYIEADTVRNALMIRGTKEQLNEVRTALRAIGETGSQTTNMRIITLDKGSAATLAEALERLLPRLRDNPVNIVIPGSDRGAPKPPPPGNEPPRKPEPPREKPDGRGAGLGSSQPLPRGIEVALANDQLSDPRANPKPKEEKPAAKKPTVNIMAFGNRLIITSEDPAALALAQELVRLITQTPGGEGDFEVIRLVNANATEAARILDEAFNGPRQQAGSQRGGGGPGDIAGFIGRFAGMGAPPPPSNPSANRIRVVADPATNSLLVRASPLDMLTIRRLLEKAIDAQVEGDIKAVIRTWKIGPLKHATATEVANVIRDVYREQMNNTVVSTTVGGFPGFGIGDFGRRSLGLTNMDATGNPRRVSLSLGVDDRSNMLILACSEALYEDVKKLAEQLDLAAKESNRTVRVISIQGIDPIQVQMAIEAIQGRRSTFRSSSSSDLFPGGSGSSGGFSIPGSNGGGFRSPFGSGSSFPSGSDSSMPFGPGRRGGSRGSSGGGIRPGPDQESRGPDFFEQRVTDDPQQFLLYDPQHDSPVPHQGSTQHGQPAPGLDNGSGDIRLTAAEQPAKEQPKDVKPPIKGSDVDIRGPRSPVNVEALEQLGVIVISGNNQADVDAVIEIIRYIREHGVAGDILIQLVPLEQADPTSVSAILTDLFSRVVVGTGGNTRAAAPRVTMVPGRDGPQQTTQQPPASVVLLPVPRLHAILVAAPRSRMEDILKEVKRLDRPSVPASQATPFQLKKASAARVSQILQQFYAQRYPGEQAAEHQVRITYDDSSNTLFVQASPSDMDEIRTLIHLIDNTVSKAVNDLRIIPLKQARADELSLLLQQAISQGVVMPTAGAVPGVVPSPTGLAGLGQTGPGQIGGGQLGGLLGQRGLGAGSGLGLSGLGGMTTKSTTLRFLSNLRGTPGAIEAGLLEDVHLNADVRTNSLIIAAPKETMDLLRAVIQELDRPPTYLATVKVFTLQKADAATLAAMLQQLYYGGGTFGQTRTGVGGTTGLPGAGGLGTTAGLTGALGVGATGGRPLFTLGGPISEGASLIDLRFTVDERTNSLIVAGSDNDLQVIEAMVSLLEKSNVQQRQSEVYRLHNVAASDVAAALQTFLTRSLDVLNRGAQLTAFQEIQRDVVIVAEPISNSLLISATPRYFADVMRLIHELDTQPPQVVIQVLIAEVDLNNSEEFGVEIGLQSPVLFQRSIIPADGLLGNGTINYANAAGGLVAPGVTVNSTINPAAFPGFNFNNIPGVPGTAGLGNNPAVGPGIVGFQGLGNLGVGRVSPSGSNLGGFVFTAASDSFNLLIRALKTQGRLDILSRPQIMTQDSQTASLLNGQRVPYVTGQSISALGNVNNIVDYQNIGVSLTVTPRINPDGKVVMRVRPEVSSISQTGSINIGNGAQAVAFNTQYVETTVTTGDGETVAIGGLIATRDAKTENKIPWFGDLPYVGAAFRYRSQTKAKTELLVILTPHVVRSRAEADRILSEESRRMDWIIGDVAAIHGTTGLEPILPQPRPMDKGPGCPPGEAAPGKGPAVPPVGGPAMPTETAPAPRPLPPGPGPAVTPAGPQQSQAPGILPVPVKAAAESMRPTVLPIRAESPYSPMISVAPSQPPANSQPNQPAAPPPQPQPGVVTGPMDGGTQQKESKGWNLFRKK